MATNLTWLFVLFAIIFSWNGNFPLALYRQDGHGILLIPEGLSKRKFRWIFSEYIAILHSILSSFRIRISIQFEIINKPLQFVLWRCVAGCNNTLNSKWISHSTVQSLRNTKQKVLLFYLLSISSLVKHFPFILSETTGTTITTMDSPGKQTFFKLPAFKRY